MSKVFRGLTVATADVIKEKDAFVKLWCHESMRVFQDRLISDDDRTWFTEAVAAECKEQFNIDYKAKIHNPKVPLLFGNWIDHKAIAEKRKYQEVTDPEEMDFAMNFFLGEYNEMTSKPMSLVLFQNASSTSRASRA